MNTAEMLSDAFQRIRTVVHEAVDGLDENTLAHRLDSGSNSIAWLIWHLTRVQDEHVAELAGAESLWTGRGWYERFALPLGRQATGYGHGPAEVALVRAPAELLTGYYDTVHERTLRFVGAIAERDLDAVIDPSWDPPVTMGVRLISVIADDLQHAGQAAFLRGVLSRARTGQETAAGR